VYNEGMINKTVDIS